MFPHSTRDLVHMPYHSKNLRVKFMAVSQRESERPREENLPTRPPHENKNTITPGGESRKEL